MSTRTPTAQEDQQGHAANWLRALRGLRQDRGGDGIAGYLFIAPAVILFIIFNAYPLIRGFAIAFSDYRYLIPGHAPFNGFNNWVEMANDRLFWSSLGRSFQFAGIYVALNFALAFLVAVLITEIRSQREASVYRAIAYLPVVLPIAIALLVWKQLLSPQFGYIDYFLRNVLHFSHTPNFLNDPNWTVPVLATIAAWKAVGSNVLLLLVGLYSISHELYEAAALDGAGWWRRLWSITVPLLRPSFTIIFVLAAGVLGAAEESLIFFGITTSDAGVQGSGRLIGRYAYEIAFLQGDLRWGYAAAINLTVGLISMVISGVIFRALRSGRI